MKQFPGVLGNPGTLLGSPAYEAEAMDGAIATGNDYVLVFGDFDNYVIADRFSSVETIPHLFGANNRPTGQGGVFAFFRVGADSVNDGAFRLLKVYEVGGRISGSDEIAKCVPDFPPSIQEPARGSVLMAKSDLHTKRTQPLGVAAPLSLWHPKPGHRQGAAYWRHPVERETVMVLPLPSDARRLGGHRATLSPRWACPPDTSRLLPKGQKRNPPLGIAGYRAGVPAMGRA